MWIGLEARRVVCDGVNDVVLGVPASLSLLVAALARPRTHLGRVIPLPAAIVQLSAPPAVLGHHANAVRPRGDRCEMPLGIVGEEVEFEEGQDLRVQVNLGDGGDDFVPGCAPGVSMGGEEASCGCCQ